MSLTSLQIRQFTAQLTSLHQDATPLRIALAGHYTLGLLRPYWDFFSSLHGFRSEYLEAPYGNTYQFFQTAEALNEFTPDMVFLLLRWEDLVAGYESKLSADREALVEECKQALCDLLHVALDRSRCPVLFSLLPSQRGPGLGNHDLAAQDSDRQFYELVRDGIARRLGKELVSAYWVDLDLPAAHVGHRQFFDARMWHVGRFPFSVSGATAVAQAYFQLAWLLRRPKKKVLVLDGDNTLWGGIVGEDGPAGIQLGPDFPGSAYVEFQKRILDMKRRGFLLALCSKNNHEDVLEILRSHPHQVLRERDFVAMRVNWEPKTGNMRSIANELNLGIDSFVFVDDSPFECKAARKELPQITTIQTPHDPLRIPTLLDGFPELQILTLTDEDRRKSELYHQEKARQRLQAEVVDPGEFLRSLRMKMTIRLDDESQVARIAQLTQKTNQFNLTTRRYSDAEILELMRRPDSRVAHFSLVDIFGDNGIVGVAILNKAAAETVAIDSFLISCRVIGRKAEEAFLRALLQRAFADFPGTMRVEAAYLPTAKNAMVKHFWPENAFTPLGQNRFQLTRVDAERLTPEKLPIEIELRE